MEHPGITVIKIWQKKKKEFIPSAESHFSNDGYRETDINESVPCARHCTGHFPYVIKNLYYKSWAASLDAWMLFTYTGSTCPRECPSPPHFQSPLAVVKPTTES